MPNIKKIACLVVDDEPPALEVIRQHISAMPSLELTAACSNAVQALAILQKQQIDLLFLDIQLPQILGTDFIRTLKNPPKVIFTTAYRKFAIEGYELDVLDYLLKPISFERFLKAVNKLMDIPVNGGEAHADKKDTGMEQFIQFRADRKMQKISLDDILYIESLKDYTKIVTRTKNIVTKQPISSLENSLPKHSFIRIHRSYIVALAKVESYTSDLIEIGRQELPIGRMYRHEVEKLLSS